MDDIYYDDLDRDDIVDPGYYESVKGRGFGLYATIASGFKVKAFSFTAGFFLRTSPIYNNAFSGGIDVKVGYTF